MQQVCLAVFVTLVVSGFSHPPEYLPDPVIKQELYQGDILLEPEQEGKHGIIDPSYRWPHGVIFYQFHWSLFPHEIFALMGAFAEFHRRTCLRILPWSGQLHYVEIGKWNSSSCFAHVGMRGMGRQLVNLGPDAYCFNHGTIVHELMHAFGFWHQHCDPKRDDYVEIMWQNIRNESHHEFTKYMEGSDFGVGYDYGSIMHYGRNWFSSNGRDTIVPKVPNVEIGQQIGLSQMDIKKLHRMYNC